jgi:hypothetical protein
MCTFDQRFALQSTTERMPQADSASRSIATRAAFSACGSNDVVSRKIRSDVSPKATSATTTGSTAYAATASALTLLRTTPRMVWAAAINFVATADKAVGAGNEQRKHSRRRSESELRQRAATAASSRMAQFSFRTCDSLAVVMLSVQSHNALDEWGSPTGPAPPGGNYGKWAEVSLRFL